MKSQILFLNILRIIGYAGLIISFVLLLQQMEQRSAKAILPGILMIASALTLLHLGQKVHDIKRENNLKNRNK